jgi:hypothetical protein
MRRDGSDVARPQLGKTPPNLFSAQSRQKRSSTGVHPAGLSRTSYPDTARAGTDLQGVGPITLPACAAAKAIIIGNAKRMGELPTWRRSSAGFSLGERVTCIPLKWLKRRSP